MKNSAYSALGGVFEYLNCDCGYEQWSQYLIEKLKEAGAPADGADIGCGNGYFTRALEKAGYNVVGVDISPEMLSKAVELARKEGIRAEFLLGDITKLKLAGKVGFITAVNDCINYIPREKLFKTFLKVNENLRKGGVFIFDISSEYKLRNIVGDNTFASDDELAPYIWFNTQFEEYVKMDITVFLKNADGAYSRRDESQIEYIHSEEDVICDLNRAGFQVTTEGHLGGEKQERINFICVKK